MEIAAAKKQRDHYLSKLEKSRVVKHIQERRKKVCHVLHTYRISKFSCITVYLLELHIAACMFVVPTLYSYLIHKGTIANGN